MSEKALETFCTRRWDTLSETDKLTAVLLIWGWKMVPAHYDEFVTEWISPTGQCILPGRLPNPLEEWESAGMLFNDLAEKYNLQLFYRASTWFTNGINCAYYNTTPRETTASSWGSIAPNPLIKKSAQTPFVICEAVFCAWQGAL